MRNTPRQEIVLFNEHAENQQERNHAHPVDDSPPVHHLLNHKRQA
jgi:hypothetical protein